MMGILSLTIDNFRSFPPGPTRIPPIQDTSFSPSLNLLVGPNGSGKTTVLNALSLAFGRSQENSQGHFVSQLFSHRDQDHEHHERRRPWSIVAAFDYGVPKLKGEIVLSRSPKDEPRRLLNGKPCALNVDEDPLR